LENAYKNEGEIKIFPGKQKMRDFIVTRCNLLEMLKGVKRTEHLGKGTIRKQRT
jgi:hypothetical protein